MNAPGNEVCNLFVNTHERIKIYRKFYHCIIYIANEGRHVRSKNKLQFDFQNIHITFTVLYPYFCYLFVGNIRTFPQNNIIVL